MRGVQLDTCFKVVLDTEIQCGSNKVEKTPDHLIKNTFLKLWPFGFKTLKNVDFKKDACSVLSQLLVFDQFHISLINSFPSAGKFLLRYCIAVLLMLSFESLLHWFSHLLHKHVALCVIDNTQP